MSWKLVGGIPQHEIFGRTMEFATGTSDGSGEIALTFTKTYAAAPIIIPFAVLSDLQHIKVTAANATTATVHVFSVASDTATDVVGKEVNFLIIEA